MGDAEYRNCIESGMDWCDANEPVEGRRDTFPILVQGRFQVAALRMRDSDAPDPGSGDCYNRVTETCNRKHPGKDMGDPEYRSCINDGLDWCDIHEPLIGGARVFPILVGGRMKVLDR
jgi:hypothetical protein